MLEKPVFIQGLFFFVASGLTNPVPFNSPAMYIVNNKRAQTIYFRAGNPTAEMIYLVLTRRGVPIRYFPVAQRALSTYRWPL